MKIEVRRSPQEIEKEFATIKNKINQCVLKEDYDIPSDTIFQSLDDEFKKIQKEYEKRNDQKNLLHVEHNYLWSKSFQYLHENPTKSLSLIIKAISKLLARHELYPYKADSFERMLGPYKVALIKISAKKELINFDDIEEEFTNFIETYSSTISSEGFGSIIDILTRLFLDNHYDKRINELKITSYPNISETEDLLDDIKSILDILENSSNKTPYLTSLCCEAIYRLRKKQLHFLVSFVWKEKDKEKKEEAQKIIDQITDEMITYSSMAIKNSKKYIRKLPPEKQTGENIRLMITLKEIDKLTADYYKEAYSNRDILKAWGVMDRIKQFLVMKAFNENVKLSDRLLKYYGEEWSLLYVFAKICLLKEEVSKRASSLSHEWGKDMFKGITRSLEGMEGLFKYKMMDKKDYKLKIMTSSFAGDFSEYFIHELCQEFFNSAPVDEKTPPEFKNLLECIKLAGHKDDIILNDVIVQGKPDIDIHIKNKCAIFLKNSKIESDEMKKIWGEIELCRKKRINRVSYGINFIKNIEKIEYVRKSFEKIKTEHTTLDIDVFDIKDLVSVFLNEIERSGKSKLKFSQLDLYRVLDY